MSDSWLYRYEVKGIQKFIMETDKLKEMQELFLWQARIHHVLPLDDRTLERFNPALVGRPDLMHGRTSLTLYPGMESMLENTFLNLKNQNLMYTSMMSLVYKYSNLSNIFNIIFLTLF